VSSYKSRKATLKAIAESRGSAVISYVTGDRRQLETQISPEIIDLFVEHLDEIGPTKKISLLLHTNGGDTAAAWRLVNLLHTFCDELEVIITAKALSAGTLISLGANKIVMTKQAALGPIDPSINHPLNPLIPNAPHVKAPVSVEAIRGYLDAATELGIKDASSLTQILVDLSNKVHPLVLGQIFRSREQIRFLAKKLLKRQLEDEQKTKEIIDFLCAESGSHDYTINRREARDLGLNIENPSDELYGLLRKLHLSYVDELKLLEPYDPYSLLGTDQTTDYALPRAAIESVKTGSHKFLSEGTLTKTVTQQVGPAGPFMQDMVNDNRKFEGWRKTS
jgi:ClpP class serine protease